MMAQVLVVTRAFGAFARGERIRDAAQVKRFAASHPDFVRVIEEPDPAAPAADKSAGA